MRDQHGKLAGWDLPRDHFETNISNLFEPVLEEVPEVKCPHSYQATFEGTPGTMHMNEEGVVFVYFNDGSKNFERVRMSQLMLTWSYRRRKYLLFHLIGQIPLHLRDRLSSRYLGCLCKPLHYSNQRSGCPYRQPRLNS
jgi:hypothetical protein